MRNTWLPLRLELAWRLDQWEARARRLLEKWGAPQAWLAEFIAYRGDPRMTLEEFHVRYTLLRMDAERHLKTTMTEAEAIHFYLNHDYMLWRNLVHRRHTPWRRVLMTMPRGEGNLLEFGCGIAPVSAWCQRRRPTWWYQAEDLEGPAWRYAQWRLKRGGRALLFDVITALDVFEHLSDPEKHARALVERLRPGGYLHSNFVSNPLRNDLDLATVEQRDQTLAYLRSALRLVWAREGYTVWTTR